MQKITIELQLGSEEANRVLAALNGSAAPVAEEKKEAPKKPRKATAKAAAKTTEAAPAVAPTPPAEVKETETETPKSKYSIEDVRAMIKTKAVVDRDAVVAALEANGAKNATELKPENYEAVMDVISLI